MPLLDHFHPPLSEQRHWEAFHSRWASAIADSLNDQGLPDHLFAEPTVHIGGQVEVDVATLEKATAQASNGTHATATLPQAVTAAAPTWVIPAVFPDSFEIQLINSEGGSRLVAAIELVSPSNKDRPETRRAFAAKCASYLSQGIHLSIVDVVTSRSANLHNEMMDLMAATACRFPPGASLYAASYRAVRRESRDEIDVWPATLRVGDVLPTLSLFVAADLAVVLDFEASYQETCTKLRLR